jgi:hypothetical protein
VRTPKGQGRGTATGGFALRLYVVGSLVLALAPVSCGSQDKKDPVSPLEMAYRLIVGRWSRIHDAPDPFRPRGTPAAVEITFFRDGTFASHYEGEELAMLREYLKDDSLGPEVNGRYRIMGRKSHDLWLVPLHVEMEFGPRLRSLTVSEDELILGNVGDSWPEARYARSR